MKQQNNKQNFILMSVLALVLFGSIIIANSTSFTFADGQSGTTLSATKTATGFNERTITYDWTVEKTVDDNDITVELGDAETVTFTIDATRSVTSDVTLVGVRGQVCVTNGGEATTENLKIVDQVQYKTGSGAFQNLAGATQTINPAQLAAGANQCYDYEITFTPVSGATYKNTAKITITNHSGHLDEEFGPEPKADFSLPTSPTTIEIDEAADVDEYPAQVCPAGFICDNISDAGPWHFTGTGSTSFTEDLTNDSVCEESRTKTNSVRLVENDTLQTRTDSVDVNISTGECIPPESIPGYHVIKFYDANVNGINDDGQDITGWKINTSTNGDQSTQYDEVPSVVDTLITVSEYSSSTGNWIATTPTSSSFTLVTNGLDKTVEFGNVCLGGSNGKTLGFWSNKNGQALITTSHLSALTALNLRNADGSDFDPSSAAALSTWLKAATAQNMANMLSAQLAAMKLNVLTGMVSGTSMVYAPGTPSANSLGFTTINALMADADAQLAANPITTSASDPVNRTIQGAIKDALDRGNNNLNFVQTTPCNFSFQ